MREKYYSLVWYILIKFIQGNVFNNGNWKTFDVFGSFQMFWESFYMLVLSLKKPGTPKFHTYNSEKVAGIEC